MPFDTYWGSELVARAKLFTLYLWKGGPLGRGDQWKSGS